MAYKPNFNTELPWPKVLEFLNELLEHEIDSSSSNGEMEYILVGINRETKDTLCRLGIDLYEIEEDFCNLDENWLDITSVVWGDITFHYGHDIWYTGKEFVVYDGEKEELVKAGRKLLNGLDLLFKIDGKIVGGTEEFKRVVSRIEGDTE